MERRSFRAELQTNDGENHLCGYAIVFNAISQPLPDQDGNLFVETILPGAVDLTQDRDIKVLRNHDTSKILGSTTAGTAKLTVDDHGLYYDLILPNNTDGNDLLVSVQRKDVDTCSFGFNIVSQKIVEHDDLPLRQVQKLALFEISVGVSFPAYPNCTTSVLRSLTAQKERASLVRQRRMLLDAYRLLDSGKV
jgi:uncharacterized protein